MLRLIYGLAAALHPSRDWARAVRSVRAMESLQACGPAIRRAAVIRRARALEV